jgi:hypothetical protein
LRHTDSSSVSNQSPTSSLGRDSTLSSVYDFPALSKSPSWLPPVKYALPESNRYETNVTTLDNGLRVCIDVFLRNKFFHWIDLTGCFGKTLRWFLYCWRYRWNRSLFIHYSKFIVVIISAGPRFEGNYLSGVSHFLEKLAFMVRNHREISSEFEFEIFSRRKNIKIVNKSSIHYMKWMPYVIVKHQGKWSICLFRIWRMNFFLEILLSMLYHVEQVDLIVLLNYFPKQYFVQNSYRKK